MISMCKREYDLDDMTVKFLIGHAPDSKVMENTYAHLAAEDHIKKAERAAGLRDDEEESSLTPEHCNTCGEPLGPQQKACGRCGTVYTPDARSSEKKIEDAMFEGMSEAEDNEERDAVTKFRTFVEENPEIKRMFLDE
jgi:hypothetical protein